MVPHDHLNLDKICHTETATPEEIKKCEQETLEKEGIEFFWVVMNTVIVLTSSFYCMFYARIFEQFGRMVKLIGSVL